MRFGFFIPQGWRHDLTEVEPKAHWDVMRSLVRLADTATTPDGDFAWSSCWVYDHFHTVPAPTDQATHEAWSLMAAFAAASERVRLGQMCTCMAYREPTYLAKVAATVDAISGGRTEMGIGAGWYEHEWRAYGYGFPRAGERLLALDEGVQIMANMWRTGSSGTFEGKRYQVDGALCYPQPLQTVAVDGKPVSSIPLWIAGGGERKTLLTAAKYAQYTNFAGDLETFTHKSTVLREHCANVGRDFAEITRSGNFNVLIGTEKEIADKLAWLEAVYTKHTPEKADAELAGWRNAPLRGTPEQIVETLQQWKAAGLGYQISYFPNAAEDHDQIATYAREVIPALR
ncbi:Luciferase-like monooxygenase [Xylanimonas cellulosilytica DSM 15894]|uniref:Luciferase-like monooxygenase n=1 Tax=Xylanimonas cellulosilytica (strain DSM 15894 / JCM 12276 / CECT 5975 / KCTC 9989 / LMG 20990 / NBRC 107835 / XIL07) TaxID=446471 RepID=D1BWX6_XYLCX|nr:TIGR03560 family F420-dependent LLM class oxidoreductase [Xylanimonas cellulosilytica]ACZ29708.1 Luciferase-like monooxygenase [Xylanimonas cellulosilytica DSM 15894]